MNRRASSGLRLLLAALAVVAPRLALAADAQVCTSCEACTAVLAVPGARAELGEDVTGSGDACVIVRGERAIFDGLDHVIRPRGALAVGVRVEARGALVRNVRVAGAEVGVLVAAAPEVTLFHATLEATRVGVRVEAADGFRLTRSYLKGGTVGVSFGAGPDGACAGGAAIASPGAVVNRTYVEGAGVGVAACDAVPVVTRSTLVRSGVGLVLGGVPAAPGPKGGPYDPCLCAPTLPGVKAATTLFFTSGCGGCEVHEGWMPELKQSHDIRVRESGRETLAIAAKFDEFLDRCAPEATDVLGIPGCVPNYICLASDVTGKVRAGDAEMTFEAHVDTQDDVARFATECAAAAARSTRAGPSCVAHALEDNVICDNAVDIRGGGPGKSGVGNSCGAVDGWSDEGARGCSSACPASLPAPPPAVTRAPRAPGPPVPEPPPAPDPPAPPAEPAPPPPPAEIAPRSAPEPAALVEPAPARAEGAPPMLWLLGGAGGLGALFFLTRLVGGAKTKAVARRKPRR